jgi:CRISPR-associated protein Cas6
LPIIDLSFDMVGTTIPLDHGYALFSALCRVVPTLHGDRRVGVHPIRGLRSAPGELALTGGSRLRLRLPSENLAPYITLAGSAMDLGSHRVRVGIPRVESLAPAANLASRLVTFRGRTEPAIFEESVRQHLSRQGVRGEPSFVSTAEPRWTGQPKRRVMKIKEKRIVGFALRVTGLTAEESLTLQENGLGGRRRFGCGVFVPF